MPAKKSVSAEEKKAEWKGFYNCYLTKQDKAQIKKLLGDTPKYEELLLLLADNGYKVSIVYSPTGAFYVASAYAHTVGHVNAGYSLSSRHADLNTAITALWWIVVEKHNMGRWPVDDDKGSQYDW